MRALRQHAGRYLAQVVSSGETIEITDHGRPVARLVAITGNEDIRDLEPLNVDYNASEALAQLRAQER